MATSKSGGATRLGRDSQPKYLGIKIPEGKEAKPGMIIIKQRGSKYRPGKNVKKGGDDTLFAMKTGKVSFRKKKVTLFDGSTKLVRIVDLI
jgi:large subunit ribosomal protein L27